LGNFQISFGGFCELVSPAHTIVSDNDDDDFEVKPGTSSSSLRPASGKGLGRGKIWANVKKHYKGARDSDSDSDSDIKIVKEHWQRQLVRSYKRKLAEKAKYDKELLQIVEMKKREKIIKVKRDKVMKQINGWRQLSEKLDISLE
jgi:hypothetical protein